jgi:hypothetical protein
VDEHGDMKRSKETFKSTPELGRRHRQLRLRAEVTQQELAILPVLTARVKSAAADRAH